MKLLKAREAAEYLRVSVFTLGRMDKQGLLVPFRTPGGHRRYSLEMLDEYLQQSRAALAGNGWRVLVVDDGEEILGVLARSYASHLFRAASDDLQVGMRLAEFRPHLAVVNTRMEGLDAWQLCQRLSTEQPNLAILPFEIRLAKSGAGDASDYERSDLSILEERMGKLLGGAPPGAP
jgi:excisionase family DNA binding protein